VVVVGERQDAFAGVLDADAEVVHPPGEDVRIVVELRDGDPVSELSQTAVAATSGAAVLMVAGAVSIASRW
jgi:hypothetical protein